MAFRSIIINVNGRETVSGAADETAAAGVWDPGGAGTNTDYFGAIYDDTFTPTSQTGFFLGHWPDGAGGQFSAVKVNVGFIGNWTIEYQAQYNLSSGSPGSSPVGGMILDATPSQAKLQIIDDGGDERVRAGYISSNVYGLKVWDDGGSNVIFEASDTQQVLAGWAFTDTTLSSANISLLSGANPLITVGADADWKILLGGTAGSEYIGSATFSSGPLGQGWQIDSSTGRAEFQDIVARGKLSMAVFEYNVISSVGGNLLVSNSDVLAVDMTAADASTLTVDGDATFAIGEVIRLKDGTNDEWMRITDDTGAPTYVVARDLAGSYGADANPVWTKGSAVVSTGSAGGGYINLDASSAASPFIDVVLRNSATYDDLTTTARLGNLSGISDADFGGALSGYGIYTENGYFKGNVTLANGEFTTNIAPNQRITINEDEGIGPNNALLFYRPTDSDASIRIDDDLAFGSETYAGILLTNVDSVADAEKSSLGPGKGSIYRNSVIDYSTGVNVFSIQYVPLSADTESTTRGTLYVNTNFVTGTGSTGDAISVYATANQEANSTGDAIGFYSTATSSGTGAAYSLYAAAGDVYIADAISNTQYIQLEAGLAAPAWSEGVIFYDDTEKTLAVYNNQSDVTLQLGQEIYVRATNKTGVTITNGSLVYVTGAQGSRPTIALAKSDASATSGVLAIATHDILDNATGFCTTFGLVRGLNTSGQVAGDEVYLSDATAGTWTATPPTEPSFAIQVGTVLFSNASDGVLFVNMGPTDVVRHMVIESLAINNDFYVDTNVLYVDSTNDRVGIGTATPARPLEVSDTGFGHISLYRPTNGTNHGSLLEFALNDSGNARTIYADIYGAITTNTATSEDGYLVLRTMRSGTITEAMRVLSSGNVGIGTATPDLPLDVSTNAGNILGDVAIFQNTGASSSLTGARIILGGVGGDHLAGIASQSFDSTGTGKGHLAFYSSNGSGLYQGMILDRLGNVGIGTAAPSVLMHLYGGDPRIRFEDSVNGLVGDIGNSNNFFTGVTAGEMGIRYADKLHIGISSPLVTIDGTGNVGIGTATPDELLTVGTALGGSVTGGTGITVGGTRYAGTFWGTDTNNFGFAQYDSTDDALRFQTKTSSTVYADTLVLKTGDVGVNNPLPLATLDVIGDSRFGDSTTNYVSIEADGDVVYVGGSGIPYINIWDNTSNTITIPASGATVELTGAMNAVGSHNITWTDQGSVYRADVTYAGLYMVNWSIAFTAAAANQEIEGGVMIEGLPQESGQGHRKIGTGTDTGSMSGNGLFDLSAGQGLSLFVQNHTSSNDITIEHVSFNIIQVGGT